MKALGRKPVRRDHRVKALALYKRALALVPPPDVPPHHGLPRTQIWPMDMNDSIGDCTIAGVAHLIQLWTAATQAEPRILTDAEVLAAYEALCGYNPAIPSTDQGGVEQDILQAWMRDGIAGDKLEAYSSINVSDLDEMRDAICWFGGTYIGLNLPQSAMDDDALWELVPNSPIVGGHCVVLVDYERARPSDGKPYFYAISWGRIIAVTPEFLLNYMEEAYAPLSRDFIKALGGTTPAGLTIDQLVADMDEIKNHT